ncbi:MAG TPA: hypothetical protein VIH96_14065 [Paraburkholderia sp.]|jgi:hypothetical protein
MYRFFRRFERLAFGIVTASAIVCTAVLLAHRYGDALASDFVPLQAANAGVPLALVCEDARQVGACEQLLAQWRVMK